MTTVLAPRRSPSGTEPSWSAAAAGLATGALLLDRGRIVAANDAARQRLGPLLGGRRLEDLVLAEDLLVVREILAGPPWPARASARCRMRSDAGWSLAVRLEAAGGGAEIDEENQVVLLHWIDEERPAVASPGARAAGAGDADDLAAVAHDLQSPLAAVQGGAQLLAREGRERLSPTGREALALIAESAERGLALVRNLLALDGGAPVVTAGPALDPLPAARAVLRRHAEAARRRGVTLDGSLEATGIAVRAAEEAFARVLDNLVSNAIKFNREGGRVDVALRRIGDDWLLVEVRDTGIGIPASDRARLFERSFRGRNAAAAPGSGLGLAAARALLARHGGRITVESAPGTGSRFRAWWPAQFHADR
jgi:signal transduction histidine kinase